jgi:hypothetical protein
MGQYDQGGGAVLYQTGGGVTNFLDTGAATKGEDQGKRFRDAWAAVLFYIQLIVVAAVAYLYGSKALDDNNNNSSSSSSTGLTSDEVNGFSKAAGALSVVSFVVSAIFLLLFTRSCVVRSLIKISLFMNLGFAALGMLYGFQSGNVFMMIFGVLFFALTACYIYCVWSRIPFATANLVTGVTAVNSNCGLYFAAIFCVFLSIGWNLLWSFATAGVDKETETCTIDQTTGKESCNPNGIAMFGLLVAFFWTNLVIAYTLLVTIAGTVGTWWYTPEEASSCCSKGQRDSFLRATTYSFGSICMGALLLAIVKALRTIADEARRSDDGGFLACIASCILSCLESIIEYFNKWAYVYVGLYGYSYLEAGKATIELFKARGWEAIIADDLVDNALFLSAWVVGLITGGVGVGISKLDEFDGLNFSGVSTETIFFFLGLILGLVIALLIFNVLISAVNTVIVLFAEGPREFQQNHPRLFEEMVTAWGSRPM